MHDQQATNPDQPLRVGSLFAGYGGLGLAVEQVFGAETVWFSDVNDPVARVFAHHWPDAPNLGDITTINWRDVPPGGHPLRRIPLPQCQVRAPRCRPRVASDIKGARHVRVSKTLR
ncbi:DNA cytosine methyltransferase [Pseudarthrobacter sp. J1738]|uniref:DNA cytosine methyltransferase n=1 Tax=Micrococcales TaxID=85006 RepID=UPI003B792F3F